MDTLIEFVAADLYVLVVMAAALIVLLLFRKRAIELAIAALVTGAIAYLLSKLGTNLISDPRPFLVEHTSPLITSATDNGFPSDHTLLLATVAVIITLANWRIGVLFWFLALLVGLARVYVRVHHLLDIGGSIVIVLFSFGCYWLFRLAWFRFVVPRRKAA